MDITNTPALDPTPQAYGELQAAYDFFNRALFDGELPPCLITLQRKGRYNGFYSDKQFKNGKGDHADEIAINPKHMSSSFEVVMSTLVHEMAHLWQYHFGKPSRGGYHNREWAEKMLWLGLRPTNNDDADKMTGQSMSHRIVDGGRFALACAELKKTGLVVTWHDKEPFPPPPTVEDELRTQAEREEEERAAAAWEKHQAEQLAEWEEQERVDELEEEARKAGIGGKSGKRTTYRCPECGDFAQGKATLHLICGQCDRRMLRDGLTPALKRADAEPGELMCERLRREEGASAS
jgi:predicted SprT family Zn-dependent metalloprotease